MKSPRFDYHAPATLDEALELKGQYREEGRFLAGGQSLLGLLHRRAVRPAVVIDLRRIRELDGLTVSDEHGIRVGAMVRQRAVERAAEVCRALPVLPEAIAHIASVPVRNRGTVCGSLAHADPAAELPAVALCADARLVVVSSRTRREVRMHDLPRAAFETTLAPDELIVEVRFPAAGPSVTWGFAEVARRFNDPAVCAAVVRCQADDGAVPANVTVVLAGVAGSAVRAPEAEAAAEDGLSPEKVGAAARVGLSPPDDVRATSAYRLELAGVLVERAYAQALTDREVLRG